MPRPLLQILFGPDAARSRLATVLLVTGASFPVLLADYWSGPYIRFPILFLVPVALAAYRSDLVVALLMSTLLPLAHLFFSFLWDVPWTMSHAIVNALIKVATLAAFAVAIYQAAQKRALARQLTVLQGLLPICAFCKKIRDDREQWQPIEKYVSERSDAEFSHGLCPECATEHYGQYLRR